LGEGQAVDAVEKIKQRQGVTDFVLLQVADEVPLQIRGASGDFFAGLLHAAFPEKTLSGGGGRTNSVGGVGFRDGHELYGCRVAARAEGGRFDAATYVGQMLGDLIH
jgi:hypothetical protein